MGYAILISAHINNLAKTTQDQSIKSLIEGNVALITFFKNHFNCCAGDSEWQEFLSTNYAAEVVKREPSATWKPSEQMLRSNSVIKVSEMKVSYCYLFFNQS